MDTMRDIKIRLSSINSTKQITESMRLVSKSKVQKARNRMDANNQYLTFSKEIINRIKKNPSIAHHEYIVGRETKNSLIIMIAGDRGLCGGYNSNVGREAFALSKELESAQIITIGSKGSNYFKRRHKQVLLELSGISESPFFEDAQNIGEYAFELFDNKTIDQIFLVGTEYLSILNQSPKTTRLLPLEAESAIEEKRRIITRYEPGVYAYFEYAVKTYVCSMIFGAMLEASVSEQSARITSMDSAQKNSNKLIDRLHLEYNQMRQGAITQEVAEIVGGANAVSQTD